MDTFAVSTVVYLPPEPVYEFLLDFPRYANYSKHLRSVRQRGDGTPGTEYDLRFAWWKLGYTARSRVTDVDPPARIDWEITRDLAARGAWVIEPAPEAAPPDRETVTRVRLVVNYDPETVDEGILDLPLLVSFDWVVGKVEGLIVREGERVVERVVADLEGEPRPVELRIEE